MQYKRKYVFNFTSDVSPVQCRNHVLLSRVANDKVIEGFAKLVTHTEEKKKCVIVDEKRQVELKDIKSKVTR